MASVSSLGVGVVVVSAVVVDGVVRVGGAYVGRAYAAATGGGVVSRTPYVVVCGSSNLSSLK